MNQTQPIIIIGGGDAGLAAAHELERRLGGRLDIPIFLIEPQPYYLPLGSFFDLVVGSPNSPTCRGYDQLLAGTSVHHIREHVVNIDPEERVVITDHHRLPYGDLIFALHDEVHVGVRASQTYGNSFSCHSLTDILNVRSYLLSSLRRLRGTRSRACFHHLAIIGADALGVEAALAWRYLVDQETRRRGLPEEVIHISLVEAAPHILPSASAAVRRRVARILKHRRIATKCGLKLTYEQVSHFLHQEAAYVKTVFWTTGTTPHRLYKQVSGLRQTNTGEVITDTSLQAIHLPHYWFIQARSHFRHKTETDWVGQARHIAQAIATERLGEGEAMAYHPTDPIFSIQLGPKHAILARGTAWHEGRLAYEGKRLLDLKHLTTIMPWSDAWATWLGKRRDDEDGVTCPAT